MYRVTQLLPYGSWSFSPHRAARWLAIGLALLVAACGTPVPRIQNPALPSSAAPSTPTPNLTRILPNKITPLPSEILVPSQTPLPGVTEVAQDGLITFTSTALGITFSYRPSQFGVTVRTWVSGDKVYVYTSNQAPTHGQYVQVFHKRVDDSLRQAIQQQVLAGASPKDCQIIDTRPTSKSRVPQGYVRATIMLALPTGNLAAFHISNPEALFQKCPETYTQYEGAAYFMEDTNHPDRYFFFYIGQYWIYSAGPVGYGDPWEDTLRVIDASQ
jgi:hypothetical protein